MIGLQSKQQCICIFENISFIVTCDNLFVCQLVLDNITLKLDSLQRLVCLQA